MNFIDNVKLSFLILIREKKKFTYTFILFILAFISLSLFVYKYNINKMIEFSVNNNIGFRTYVVSPRLMDGDTNNQKNIENIVKNDIEELMKLDHVLDVYNPNYYDYVASSDDFSNSFIDGTITLVRGTKKTMPTIIYGRNIKNGESGVAICPKDFYPNYEPRIINKKYVIDGYTLLGKKFTIKYGTNEENIEYTKTFEIVGIYNSFEQFNDNGTCYISENDIIDIVNQSNKKNIDSNSSIIKGIPSIYIVVDNENYMDEVKSELQNLMFEDIELASMINFEMINKIFLSFLAFFIIILIAVVIIMPNYTKLRIKSEEKNIGVMRTCGFSKKDILKIYILKILIQYICIYIVSAIIFIITFNVIKSNVQTFINYDYMLGGLKVNFLTFIMVFFLNVVLPVVAISPYLNKICTNPIIKLTKEK